MNRVWDYIGFAVCFAGLGYIALWLIGSPEHLVLPAALHALGGGAAAFVPVRLIMGVISRRRAADGALPAPRRQARRRCGVRRSARLHYPIRQVKPRSHFGLRGVPD